MKLGFQKNPPNKRFLFQATRGNGTIVEYRVRARNAEEACEVFCGAKVELTHENYTLT